MERKIVFLSTLIFIGFFGWAGVLRAAYVMPVGIPAPAFGLEESVESVYGDANYYTYWVDNTRAGCSDSGNGSPLVPRCTIPSLSSLPAGAVVQLRGGPYIGSTITVTAAGTFQQPVFIRGDSAANKVSMQRRLRVTAASYLIIENINWTNLDESDVDLRPAANGQSISRVAVRNNELTGIGTNTGGGAAISLSNASYDMPVNNIVLANNIIREFGDWQAPVENDKACMAVGGNIHHIWYLWNTGYHCAGDGVGTGHDANHTTYDLYIGGNVFHNNRENAVDLKEVHNVIISENTMYGFAGSSSSEGAAVVLHYGPTGGQGPYNTWTINNLIYDSEKGYAASDVESGNYVIGNVIYNTGSALDLNASGGGGFYIYHNTIANSGVGEWWGVTTDALDVGGNIVANTTSGAHMRVDTSPERALATFEKELYYQGGALVTILWGTAYNSVSSWISGSGKGAGSLQSDPLFIGTGNHPYSLRFGSPAIDAGKNMSSVASALWTAFGTSLLRDRAGISRPNGIWDIGAYEYEYVSGGDTTPPAAPMGLNIN